MQPGGESAGWRASPSMRPLPGTQKMPAGRGQPVVGRAAGRPGLCSFDRRDNAPEDRRVATGGGGGGVFDPSMPLVRGSLRLEGVNFAKYEGAKVVPDRQNALTTALRDDLISEAGHGVCREDILLRLTPGPIRSIVLDYPDKQVGSAPPAPPSLADAEWCVDVEYAIATRDGERQASIARALFDALGGGDMAITATRAAYVRYLHPSHPDPSAIVCVPTASASERERAVAAVSARNAEMLAASPRARAHTPAPAAYPVPHATPAPSPAAGAAFARPGPGPAWAPTAGAHAMSPTRHSSPADGISGGMAGVPVALSPVPDSWPPHAMHRR
eukprot:TRINITY_DN8414_c1_g1_i1.p1 TRINITY_DN8414_c1_g1~~TRINITY_DN8414_c1_g1_i1.p1  ORF type:complete len:330 (+),score=42.88 TRINITY_DN8414_c1_g1_i1:99-1088(+)